MPSVHDCPLPVPHPFSESLRQLDVFALLRALFFDLSRFPLPPSQRQLPKSQREHQENPAIRRRPSQHTHWIAFFVLRVGARHTLSKTTRVTMTVNALGKRRHHELHATS